MRKEMISKTIEIEQKQVKTFYSRHGRTKKTHFGLCGLAINEDGKITESKMFDFLRLDPEEYGHILLTAEEARKVHYGLQGVKWGGAAARVPLYCGGEKICPFAQECPFVEISKVPVGRKCPIEVELMTFWTSRYMQEFEVDPENHSEVGMITELVELDIYDLRASMILARPECADMTKEVVVGVDGEGNPIINKEVHKAWELKERVKKRKQKILESLVGTRKEKYKRDVALKRRSEIDPSTQAIELKRKLEKVRMVAAGS
ncbi:MAG: hypothetical protein OEV18_14670 [Deltaproteobacteria bacterium]|nr:hypothetical protein [Deltaproteobacteria bacterium]